jgi:rhamnogalacturonan acetylesterase
MNPPRERFLLVLALALGSALPGFSEAQDANTVSTATSGTSVRATTPGPVIDPAIALPDAMDNTRFPPARPGLPTLFLSGDSTMDSRPNPKEPLINNLPARIGWGGSVIPYFDTNKINIENHAKGGTSTRTFMNEGYWRAILARLKPGDFVILEFGHNDSSELDGPVGQGTLKSNGEETKLVVNKENRSEVVHTYGWYLRRFIADAEAKEATPILLSPVPRNYWKDKTTFNDVTADYTQLSKDVAATAKLQYIDMNEALAAQYAPMGQDAVTKAFFTSLDKTHTSPAGAQNAARVFVGSSGKIMADRGWDEIKMRG